MPSMLDVNYLLAAHGGAVPPLRSALVYHYRSGVLRPRLMAALKADAERHGKAMIEGTLPLHTGFDIGGLIDTLQFFHWPTRADRTLDAAALEDSAKQLCAGSSRASVHFVPHNSVVTDTRAWRTIERICLVVEEPLITSESLGPVLRYLAATSDLMPAADLLTQLGFVASFEDLVATRAELPEIVQAFDERVLLGTDPLSNRFEPARYRREAVGRSGRRAPLRHLRDLVGSYEERDLVDLVCAFDERRFERGWTAFALIGNLYTISRQLLEPLPERIRPRLSSRSRPAATASVQALLWAALVLAWDDSLSRSVREESDGYRRGPDLLVPCISGLGRDFLARAFWSDGKDPLTDRWSGIRSAVARCAAESDEDRLATARGHLVRDLTAALARQPDGMPAWVTHLRDALGAVSTSVGRLEDQNVAKAEERLPKQVAACPPPATLEAVAGRRHAVAGLLRHARARIDGVDLLLYGPDGVGKRTLARLYAQAVLCDAPSLERAACGVCASCRDLDGYPGYVEVDGLNSAIKAHTSAIVEAVKAATLFTERTVVVVRNVDRYPPREFDDLLKPMEDNPRAGFVLLAQDPNGVRPAGRSRCFDHRVRPLDRPEAWPLAGEILSVRGMTCDDEVLALIMDVSAGLPGRLHETCRLVADVVPLSRDVIRSRLGFDWVEPLIERWPEILSSAPDAALAGLMQSSDVRRAELRQRVQALLQYAYLHDAQRRPPTPTALAPELRSLPEESSARLVTMINCLAPSGDLPSRHVLAALITVWMSDHLQ